MPEPLRQEASSRSVGMHHESASASKPAGHVVVRLCGRLCSALTVSHAPLQAAKFNCTAVSAIVLQKMVNRLEGVEYEPTRASQVRESQ